MNDAAEAIAKELCEIHVDGGPDAARKAAAAGVMGAAVFLSREIGPVAAKQAVIEAAATIDDIFRASNAQSEWLN